MKRWRLAVLLASGIGYGCPARPVLPPDVERIDAGFPAEDSGHSALSALYRRCSLNWQCRFSADSDLFCNTRFPGGQCTRRCSRAEECGDPGRSVCAERCYRRCSLGGSECEAGEVCRPIAPGADSARACFPACYPDAVPDGGLECVLGLRCDPYREPFPACDVSVATGAPNGAACVTNQDCLGDCVPEIDASGRPTGFPGGRCVSSGRVASAAEYRAGAPLPQSNCPQGSVAIPTEPGAGEGDLALCAQACVADVDCGRGGYRCNRESIAGGPSTNGFCDAIDCLDARYTGMCPPGYACESSATAPGRGVCVRAMAQDGGAT